MKRKCFAMLLALAMVLSMAAGVSAAETETAPALSLEVTQGAGSVTVSVYLEDCGGVTNGRFRVDYDADVLTLAQAQTTDAYAMSSVNDETAGSVYLAWVGSELTEEKNLMLTLTLEAADGIAQDMTYTAEAEGIYADTEAVTVAGDSVTIEPAVVDTAALEKAVDTAEALDEAGYTAESWAAVKDALSKAVAVLADSDATQEEVDAAAKKLNDAIEALTAVETGVDTTELEKAIKKAESLKKSDYTSASYANMEKALKEAKAVLADADAAQEEVDAAARKLNDAIAALKEPTNSPGTGDSSNVGLWMVILTISGIAIAALVTALIRSGKQKYLGRFLCLLLAASMVLSMAPVNAFAVVNGEDTVASPREEDTTGLEALVEDRESAIVDAETNEVVGSVSEIDNPGVDLKLEQTSQQISAYADNEMVRVIVELEGKSLLEQGYTQGQISGNGTRVAAAAEKLEKLQDDVAGRISQLIAQSGLVPSARSTVVKYNYTIALNGIAMTVPYGTLDAIREVEGVKGAYVVSRYETPDPVDSAAEPNMYATSDTFGSAQTWTELGYTGAGMTIAIIDTGLDLDHPSFADAPEGASMTLSDIENVLTQLNAYSLFGQTSAVKLTADKLYRSEKVPYGFNYVDCGIDVTHDYDSQGDHGTHVAGIAAANKLDTTTVVGVAPDAQVVVMKVFGQNGGAYSDDIIAAIEDCLLLGVDVVNMSLGSQAGFSEDSVLVNEVYGRILQTDMVLAVAAGNSNSSATGNALGTNVNLTQDPDNGLVNSPATYLAATTVASLENTSMMMPYFTVDGNKIAYVDVNYNFTNLAGGELEYVIIPNYGRAEDYAGLDLTGKVAVVSRGGGDDINFMVKQENAYNAGAKALVVYNNVEGDLVSMYDGGFLPNVFVSKADGEILKAQAGYDGVGTLEVMPAGEETAIPSSVAGQLSDFSCWGVTPDLQLVPDVTAPGGNIYSCYTDGQYGTMSGTSMASPHIAGMSALVLQYLHDAYPDMTGAEYHAAAESLVMCTAVPVYDTEGVLYSPRKQGAGSANVYSAITSPVYLTSYQAATGELTPKASMGDDPARTGTFTFSFDMHNLTGEAQTYALDGMMLTDQYVEIEGREFMSETGRNLSGSVTFEYLNPSQLPEYDANRDGATDMTDVQFMLDVVNGMEELDENLTGLMDLCADGKLNTVDVQLLYELLLEGYAPLDLVTVPANSTVTVNVTVTLSAEDIAYMEAHYENGIYVDGFVRAYAQSEGAVDLSLPFMGFYGDWHDARMIDSGWYYEDEETVEYNRYLNVVFTTMGADETSAGGLGINPYILEDYDPEHNVLSPNGDTYCDYVNEIYVSLLRSAELLDFTWTDEAGNELFYEWYAYARKSYYWSGYGMCMPVIYTDGGCQPFTMYGENGELMVEELQKLTLTIRGYLDDGDLDALETDEEGDPIPNTAWADDSVEIPVVIDITAPKLDISSIVYSTEGERNYVTFDVEDNYDIAAVVAMTAGGDAYEYIPVTTKEKGVDGEKDTIKLDITDYDATFQIVLCDYGCNESYYELTNEMNTGLTSEKFFSYRRYSSPVYDDTMYSTDQLNGWYSFETADDMTMHTAQSVTGESSVYAAEYIDGYIIGAQGGSDATGGANTLFISKAGSWDRIPLGSDRAMNFTVYEWPGRDTTYFPLKLIALDMAFDYTTDTLYMLANGLENNYFPEGAENVLLKVDYLTGSVTLLGVIEPEEDEPFLALTLACDNDGVLYTVNYENGKMYTIDKTPAETTPNYGYGTYTARCFSEGNASYYPAAYAQSMTVDHETNKLYWAGYQSKVGNAYFFEVDKQTGKLGSVTAIEDNSEMVALFKPYDSGRDIIPEAELMGLSLNKTDLYLNVGNTAALSVYAEPFNGKLGDITWHSMDESIATVSPYGIMEANSIGSTTVVASCGGFEAVCNVNVSAVSGTLFANSANSWLLMDAGAPYEAALITDTMEMEGSVKAAVYHDGWVYTAAVVEDYDEDYNSVYTTNLYKLDVNTLTGSLIDSFDGNTTALAFNYADGFMYGLIKEESYDARWNQTITYQLVRVNHNTAAVQYVTDLNAIFPYSDATGDYNICSGALAIDYEGNFYVNGDMAQGWDISYVLTRFNLDENNAITNITTFHDFTEYGWNGDAMVWSERNGGILHASNDQLEWVDVSDMENVVTVSLGQVRGASGSVFALAIPLNVEPELPYVAPVSIALEESYTVPNGESIKVSPTVEPWNASAEFTYAIADETVATVDEYGVITGASEGETTITVTVVGTELTATAKVVVEKNPGYLYGFFQADLANSIPLEYWGKIPMSNPSNSKVMTGIYDFTIYAASFYDGFVYACGQSGIDGLYYILKISPANFAYEVLCTSTVMIRDMAFDYTTGAMYVAAYDEMIVGGLYQMDLNTGALTLVGDNDLGVTLVTLAVDDEGQVVAADDSGEVYLVDKNTVALTDTGISGGSSQYLQAMTYDYNNDAIYWVKGGQMSRVDLENGELVGMGSADVESGEMMTVGCIVSGLFSVPNVVVSVPETVAPMGVSMGEKNTVAVGETVTLDAVVLPVSVSAVDQTLTWTSGDETIATVEGGVVTGVSAGVVRIYATDASGNTASTLVTVTEEHRYLYGYDELSHAWVSFDFDGTVVNTWADAEGLSPIVAAQYIGETLYAYDEEGCFYSVDTETFERTLLGNGINGLTVNMEANDSVNGLYYVEDVPYRVIDMTYAESGEVYAVILAYNVSEWLDDYSYKIVQIDPATGEITRVIVEDALCDDMSLRPTNLIYRNGYLYTVNGYITGMMTQVDITSGMLTGTHIFADYWGDFNGGRSFIEDPLTGKVYAIRDMRTGYIGTPGYDPTKSQSELCAISIGVAYAESVCELGSGLRITGLFIK